jgi:hypothetical protein
VNLRSMGVKLPVDVLDIDENQLNTLKLKPLELKRWNDAVGELKADRANKSLSGVIPAPHTRTTPAEQFEEPFVFEVFDAITSVVGPTAEAGIKNFEIGWEYTMEGAFDAATGVAIVVSETLAIEDDEEDEVAEANQI